MRLNIFSETKSGYLSALVTLLASSGTLICCAIPALLVSLGAGASLASLVAIVPEMVWVSENKEVIFIISTTLIIAGGALQWRNRTAPCPIDPHLRDACLRIRKNALLIYFFSVFLLLVGAWFAYIQPLL